MFVRHWWNKNGTVRVRSTSIFTDIGIDIVGVFRIDGKSEDAQKLKLSAVARRAGTVADEIEKLRPMATVIGGFVQATDVGTSVNGVLIIWIIEMPSTKPPAPMATFCHV